MNRTLLTTTCVLAISLWTSTQTAQAALFGGDAVSIDFGTTAPGTANWNPFAYDGSGGDTTVTNLIRLSDGTPTGVDIEVTSIEANLGGFTDGSAFGGSGDPTIHEDGIVSTGPGNDVLNITISGLDDSLRYRIFGGGLRGNDFGANWSIAGATPVVDYPAAGNLFALFEGVPTNGLGQIVITLNDPSNASAPAANRNVGITELTISVPIPEPSTVALLGLVSGAALLRRRRAAA